MEHDRSADIGPQRKEHRPNSIPESYERVRAEAPNLSLIEHYVKNRAITRWEGPKYTSYNTKDARLRSFIINDWRNDLNLAPEALCEASLFFSGKNIHTLLIKLNSNCVLDPFNISRICLQVRVIGP